MTGGIREFISPPPNISMVRIEFELANYNVVPSSLTSKIFKNIQKYSAYNPGNQIL